MIVYLVGSQKLLLKEYKVFGVWRDLIHDAYRVKANCLYIQVMVPYSVVLLACTG